MTFLSFRREFIIIFAVFFSEGNEGMPEVFGIGVFPLFFPYLVSNTFVAHFFDFMLGYMPTAVTEIEVLFITGRGYKIRLDKSKP